MDNLKPCPFCGGEAEIMGDDYMRWGAVCRTCDAFPHECDTEAEAIKAWNTRAERTCQNLKQPGYNYMKCSACGEKAYQGDRQYSYCPWCGAKVVDDGGQ